MQRILLVDDEPNIVEGLFQLLQGQPGDEPDLLRAYSGREAIAWLERVPVDLVLSDIAMPGMSGLQLLAVIERLKLSCRVIFLTGYDRFEYIHEAMKSDRCAGYLLKTEGDGAILAAVQRELELRRAILDHEALLEKARLQMQRVQPVLRTQMLRDFVTGSDMMCPQNEDDEPAFSFQVDFNGSVAPVVARFPLPGRGGYMAFAERAVLLGELFAGEMQGLLLHEAVLLEDSVVWIIQAAEPAPEETGCATAGSGLAEAPLPTHILSRLQSVQNEFFRITGLPVAFAHTDSFGPSGVLPEKASALLRLLRRNDDTSERMMILGEFPSVEDGLGEGWSFSRADFGYRLSQVEHQLLHGLYDDARTAILQLFSTNNGTRPALDRYSRIAVLSMFLTVADKLGIPAETLRSRGLENLLLEGEPDTALSELCAGVVWMMRDMHQARREDADERTIEQLRRHVQAHIGDRDLSLAMLASLIHYNPSYLSRFFKLKTGKNLSEYINEVRMEKALSLLADPSVRIVDVSSRVGFESSSYFTVFFKKRTGMTPNEYRSRTAMP